MKKQLLIGLLVSSFINYIGCYSNSDIFYTYTSSSDDKTGTGDWEPDKKINILLKDSSEIECSSVFEFDDGDNIYVKVDTAGHYVAGYGRILDKNSGNESEFRGIISEGIDSTRTYTINAENYIVIWTSDNKRLSFNSGNFVHVLPEQGIGFFISDPMGNQFKIPLEKIEEVQISKINWYLSVPVIALSISLAILFFIALNGVGNAFRLP